MQAMPCDELGMLRDIAAIIGKLLPKFCAPSSSLFLAWKDLDNHLTVKFVE
jgi:hypothetical protein